MPSDQYYKWLSFQLTRKSYLLSRLWRAESSVGTWEIILLRKALRRQSICQRPFKTRQQMGFSGIFCIWKGTVLWKNFLASSNPNCIKGSKKIPRWPVINRDMLRVVSLGLLGEFAKVFASLLYTHNLSAYSETIVYCK